jgi:hypothetical protein
METLPAAAPAVLGPSWSEWRRRGERRGPVALQRQRLRIDGLLSPEREVDGGTAHSNPTFLRSVAKRASERSVSSLGSTLR